MKIVLSHDDDKPQLIPGHHETLPWGYKLSRREADDVEMLDVETACGMAADVKIDVVWACSEFLYPAKAYLSKTELLLDSVQ